MSRSTPGAVSRIAALRVADFPLQALLRAQPERGELPLAMIRGDRLGGGAVILAVTPAAQALDVSAGMTVAQARALCPELEVVLRDRALEASARDALADVARSFSPRVELGRSNELGWAFLDVLGLERIVGPPEDVARALVRAARRVGLEASVAVARTKTLARLAARGGSGCDVVPAEAVHEHAFVAALPVAALEPTRELAASLARLGIREVRNLLRLPVEEIAERLGPEALELHRRARGEEQGGGLRPTRMPVRYLERTSLDDPVDNLEPLAFVLRGLLDRLTRRLELGGMLAGDLHLRLEYEGPGCYERVVGVGAPSRDTRALLALCRLALDRDPPGQAVVAVAVQAAPVATRARQLSLFEPAGPPPDKLAVTLARLEALCGSGRVGTPRPADSYREDGFSVASLEVGGERGGRAGSPRRAGSSRKEGSAVSPREVSGERGAAGGRGSPGAPPTALRRFRPPRPVDVIWRGGVPVRIEGGEVGGRVIASVGPFRRDERWWGALRDDAHDGERDAYDVQLASGIAYRILFDRARERWLVVGWYD